MRGPVRFAAAGLALAGCAWGAGGAFSGIDRNSTLTLALPMSAGRLDSEGRWLTNNGYALTLDGGIRAPAAKVALVGAGGGGPTTVFDPARPPAGYTLCHSGHCHRSDGALIVYADVEAELARQAGGVATASIADLTWDLGGRNLAVAGEMAGSFVSCAPACGLPRGTIAGADLSVETLAASGTVEALPGAAALPGGKRTWTLALGNTGTFKGNAALAVDRDSAAGLVVAGKLDVTDKLFDDLSWAAFGAGGTMALESSQAVLATLRANFARSRWTVSLHAPR